VHSLVWSRVSCYSAAVQLPAGGSRSQNVWYPTGVSRNVEEILSYEKNQGTLREVENSYFILYQQFQMSSHSEFQAPVNKFMGFLKGSEGHQVKRTVLGINIRSSAGLETRGCLDRSSRGVLLWKVCLQKETKEVKNVLALDSFYGLISIF
jgi:hypothetical protein